MFNKKTEGEPQRRTARPFRSDKAGRGASRMCHRPHVSKPSVRRNGGFAENGTKSYYTS